MRIDGTRADGATLGPLDGGLACVVRGGLSSPAVDESEARALGPWTEADSSLPARLAMAQHLRQTRTVPLQSLRAILLADPPPAPADATVADTEEIDIEAMQEEADELAEDALAQSEAAETAEEHKAASEALEQAAAAMEAVEKLHQPAVPEMGTPEFDAYIEAEVARRVAEATGVAPAALPPVAVAPVAPVVPSIVPGV